MEFSNRNFVIVTFKDGTTLDSSGSCQGAAPHDLIEDLKFLGATLPSYIRDKGKNMLDVDTIQISIKYDREEIKEIPIAPLRPTPKNIHFHKLPKSVLP